VTVENARRFAHIVDGDRDMLNGRYSGTGDAPDFVEIGEAGVAVIDAMRHHIQHTVRYTELSPDRFRDFWR
jgi:hypothetical protein